MYACGILKAMEEKGLKSNIKAIWRRECRSLDRWRLLAQWMMRQQLWRITSKVNL